MRSTSTRVFAAFFLLALSAIAASCGGNSDGNLQPSGGGPGGDACTVSGDMCAFCSATVGCADCATDGDCGVAAPRCVLGRCAACASTADCGVAEACFPSDHMCHPKCASSGDCHGPMMICDAAGACVGCEKASDCPPDHPICSAETGQCSECGKNADCPITDPACDLADGQCHECNVDADCGAGSQCDNDHHCKSFCTADAQCDGDYPRCLLSTGDCVECLGRADCSPTNPACVDNRCVQCTSNADCMNVADEKLCDTHADQCVACLVDSDCAAPVPACHGGACVQCNDDSQCPSGDRCHHQTCMAH